MAQKNSYLDEEVELARNYCCFISRLCKLLPQYGGLFNMIAIACLEPLYVGV